jgi:GntR family transcriptional regulator
VASNQVGALDRHSIVPLWRQLADELRRRADEGDFASRFPTDAELVGTYQVSRHTAREAVRVLREEGRLERHRGRGSFLTPPRYEQTLGSVSSLFRWLESQGVEQRSEVLALDVRADPDVAERLGLPLLAPLLHLARRRLADGEPIATDEAWLPYARAEGLLGADFSHTALYEELEHRCGLVIDATSERIEAVLPTTEQRLALGLRRGLAAFCVTRSGRSGGDLVEHRRTLLRADRVVLVAESEANDLSGQVRIRPVDHIPRGV